MSDINRYAKLLVVLFTAILASGCVSGRKAGIPASEQSAVNSTDSEFDEFEEFSETEAPPVSDPLMGYNRFMFAFNDKAYVWVLKPVSKGYGYVVPERVRISIKSFFKNLSFPIRFVNNILQLKFKGGGVETLRFGVNSTIGLLGFFDPATSFFHLEPSAEDFGQTLAIYGVGDGPPIVLPIIGPSNLRDALALAPDHFLSPLTYLKPSAAAQGTRAVERVNFVSLYLNDYDEYMKTAVDPYIFFRDAYKQNRDKKIKR